MASRTPVNVVVPLGGLGTRFQKEGYMRPKPFVKVLGKEMILWVLDNLQLDAKDGLVIVYNPSFMSMDRLMSEVVAEKYPRVHLVELSGPTRGAAETVLIGLEALAEDHRSRPTLLVDGDTFYTTDIVNRFRNVSERNACFVFRDTQPKPIYSYCMLGDNDVIQEIREKVKISDWANSGCYCFRSGTELAEQCRQLLGKGDTQLSQDGIGEYYTSGVIAAMLAEGAPFVAIHLEREDFHVLGTPDQVTRFCREWPSPPQLRFVFDLDHCLLTGPKIAGDYRTCDPIARNINFCRKVFNAGHTVIIQTARRMRTHHGNTGAVVADVGQITMDSLRENNIPYHELIFGKPFGHFYIDDLMADAIQGDLEHHTGFYYSDDAGAQGPATAAAGAAGVSAGGRNASNGESGDKAAAAAPALAAAATAVPSAEDTAARARLERQLEERDQRIRELQAETARLQRQLQYQSGRALSQQLVPSDDGSMAHGGFQPPPRVGLNVIIPMVGTNTAFANAGYLFPPPLVSVVGKPLIFWSLDFLSPEISPENDIIWLVFHESLDNQFGLVQRVKARYPKLQVKEIRISYMTQGWAETILAATQLMPANALEMRTVCIDCHTIFHGTNVLSKVRDLPEKTGCSFYFNVNPTQKHSSMPSSGRYSYIRMNQAGVITQLREKVAISELANCGAYAFPSAEALRSAVEMQVNLNAKVPAPDGSGNESKQRDQQADYHCSTVISLMIEQENATFHGIEVLPDQFSSVGTPEELEHICAKFSRGEVDLGGLQSRFAFDLENTLIVHRGGDINDVDPNHKNIELVRQLKGAGHFIALMTTRPQSAGHVTFSLLHELDIPYDEVHFGKPRADLYINALGLSSWSNLEKNLGWKLEGPSAMEGGVVARAFNQVSVLDGRVVKTSARDKLRGEAYFYQSIPDSLADYFPKVFNVHDDPNSTHITISLELVQGVTFTQILTNHCLTKGRFLLLMKALLQLHKAPSAPPGEARLADDLICSNYAPKLKARFEKHRALYDSFEGFDTAAMHRSIIRFLEGYQSGARFQHGSYIHGDPVFSNVLLTRQKGEVRLIDMRGEIGTALTTQGDITYDLSKVYQSLLGYDFMLMGRGTSERASEQLAELRDAFREWVEEHYPKVSMRDIRLLTAQHYFGIVPLHEVRERQMKFLRQAQAILVVEGLIV
eukprot:TRINITY_DN4753_c0_g1_i1.p1 TRINITY_DN4753_c0_g1~~TRINITY_DN4753_c0_g1_i1.p1  ORF type:complete len:1179 (+),score=289.03 TRINITY_DN4753_c0_g1_i1:149-3685(+)